MTSTGELKNKIYSLIKWYRQNCRSMPWRKARPSPYEVWISEVMLQQTTVPAVIPYYKRFLKRFPNIKTLALADIQEVMAYWSGLGYYTRAKNLHKAAYMIHQKKHFPQTWEQLLKLPGFGPYTARAVSSLAFEEPTGVLDGNVIRVFSRCFSFPNPWTAEIQVRLQNTADTWAKISLKRKGAAAKPSIINQALMELGALVCKPANPLCPQCPLKKHCKAFIKNKVHLIPKPKPKIQKQIWLYQPLILKKNQKMAFIKNRTMPFLKNHFVFPGKAAQLKKPPPRWHVFHSITRYNIYVLKPKRVSPARFPLSAGRLIWLNEPSLPPAQKQKLDFPTKAFKAPPPKHTGLSPSSLIQKILSAEGKTH